MKSNIWIWVLVAASLALVAVILFVPPSISGELEFSDDEETLARGEYLVSAGGCISCHRGVENEEAFSGGLGLESDFGTFYVPNITPDA
ncbi:MAG: cytochrome C, partial [Gammaproteobacteria bacterium]|nr:cytochrome C [Gammaproteobacteria bacterium]